ncbi:unnamed protein product [Brachionus calyciflorus]|uniref:Uncharacterized protein n=1 Tax=Brachionus calyciflorus TaxID=104777 RepID=A0A814JSL8_9BILA|nr:unnamed protein product [Brachionus calyciflorus]
MLTKVGDFSSQNLSVQTGNERIEKDDQFTDYSFSAEIDTNEPEILDKKSVLNNSSDNLEDSFNHSNEKHFDDHHSINSSISSQSSKSDSFDKEFDKSNEFNMSNNDHNRNNNFSNLVDFIRDAILEKKDYLDMALLSLFLRGNMTQNSFDLMCGLLKLINGIELAEKSDISLWPMIFVINEIPIERRFSFDNIVIAGEFSLTLSNGKPNLNIILDKLKSDLKELELGINVLENEFLIVKFYVIAGVFDKPARSSILCINSTNGYHSCLKCIQPGKRVNTERGSVHTFPFDQLDPEGPKRTCENYTLHLNECLKSGKMCYGIKDKSILNELKYYNGVLNTSIDAMHSVFLGVCKKFFEYWISHPISKPCSLKNKISEIDTRTQKITPPSFLKSSARLVSKWRKWRAHDFMNFMLHYSLIVFNGLMNFEYYQNLKLFIVSLECLFSPRIEIENLKKVRNVLHKFVSELSALYDERIMLSGVHELLHLVKIHYILAP